MTTEQNQPEETQSEETKAAPVYDSKLARATTRKMMEAANAKDGGKRAKGNLDPRKFRRL